MRVFNQGAFVRVTADHLDLWDFASQWPCSGIGCFDRMSVTFDKRNGDLVDICVSREFASGAQVALIKDLKSYAEKRGLL